ncbi:hypothetical protein M885DRAFT_580323 [Pelagophyceae sp. CCMP2097]|nr:hypothetical protein M885DRAFT_580323 [Pelagophyceae sp. CCMP2097]
MLNLGSSVGPEEGPLLPGQAHVSDVWQGPRWPDAYYAIEDASDQMPQPIMRKVRYFMGNCGGTSKSQFCFGALALLALCGTLDALFIEFMVPGHTKFESDVAAQKTACSFMRHDVFNHCMLNAALP